MRHLILGVAAVVLAACGMEPATPPVGTSDSTKSVQKDAIEIEVRTARITEGTNMAAVVNPTDRTRYLSLQGRLFQISFCSLIVLFIQVGPVAVVGVR